MACTLLCSLGLANAAARDSEPRMKTWWFFGYEATTSEGIAADVKALREAGFGGVVYYDQTHGKDASKADAGFSPAWWKHLEEAARTATGAGLTFELNISPGYVAGGRWIDPAHAMQRVAYADTVVSGGQRLSLPLPRIEGKDGYVADIACLAFPARTDGLARHITARYKPSGKGRNGAMQMPGPRGTFSGAKFVHLPDVGTLQGSYDSIAWHDIVRLEHFYSSQGAWPWRTHAFAADSSRFFRILPADGSTPVRNWSVGSEAKLDHWEEWAALQSDFTEGSLTPDYGPGEVIDTAQVVDLSAYIRDGRLTWSAPEGQWHILRLAAVLTGARTKHGPANLLGYECDKLSAEAATLHWRNYMQPILDSLEAKGIPVTGVTMDSHEAGAQNWTPLMAQEFETHRGYPLRPYLPVLAGYVVGSARDTHRVLRDLRTTISDLMAERYYGTFRQLAADRGLTLTAQAIGNALCITGDAISVKRSVDKPQGEFWAYQQQGAYDVKDCSSAAHLYGKPIASAEAMTDAEYCDTPLRLKRVADIAFSMGAQELVVCATPHIPLAAPTAPYVAGREYAVNRSNPQWEGLKPVWRALNRSMQVLQQGQAAPDALIYLGDEIPMKTLTHRLPAHIGQLDWDVCTGDALRNRIQIAHGDDGPRLSTPDGVHYKALIVEEGIYVSPASQAKIDSLRAAGVSILTSGRDVVRDITVSAAADTVASQSTADSALPQSAVSADSTFVHTHRRIGRRDVFFIANISPQPQTAVIRLRHAPARVRLLRTATGKTRTVRLRHGAALLPFEPGESMFLSF